MIASNWYLRQKATGLLKLGPTWGQLAGKHLEHASVDIDPEHEMVRLVPVPEGTDLQRAVSPSQVVTFLECQRKWAWRAIAKIVLPPHKSAAKGTAIHKVLENYLEGNPIQFAEGKEVADIAQSAIDANLLPQPKAPGMELERAFKYVSRGGFLYHGFIDVLAPDAGIFPGLPKGDPVVSDHKSTSNFAYAKTPEDLRTDPQGVIYAMVALDHYQAERVHLVWTYLSTKGMKKAKRVHLRVLREDVEREFEKIELTVSKIVTIHQSTGAEDILSLPATTAACGNYGGCPYRYLCTDLSSINPQGKQMSASTQDMMNGLTAKLSPSEAPKAAAGVDDWLNELMAPTPAKSRNATPPPPPTDTVIATRTEDGVNYYDHSLPDINPPGEAEDVSAAMEPRPTIVDAKPKRVRRTKAQIAADAAANVHVSQTVRPGAEDEPVPYVPTDLDREPTTIPAPAQAASADTPDTYGWTLYVNCYPLNGLTVRAETLFAKAANDLLAQDIQDYRLVDYGKGAAMFAGLVNNYVDHAEDGWTSDIVLDASTPEGTLALSGLSARATRVVRGLR